MPPDQKHALFAGPLSKRGILKAVQRIRNWEAQEATEGPLDDGARTYTLNHNFLRVLREAGDHQYAWGV